MHPRDRHTPRSANSHQQWLCGRTFCLCAPSVTVSLELHETNSQPPLWHKIFYFVEPMTERGQCPPPTNWNYLWENLQYKTVVLDFPAVAVDKNLSANSGDTSLIPDPGRLHMPQRSQDHAPQLLNPHATTTEAQVPRACALQVKPPQWAGQALHLEISACCLLLEKDHRLQWRQQWIVTKNK